MRGSSFSSDVHHSQRMSSIRTRCQPFAFPTSTYNTRHVQQFHLQPPIAVPAGSLQTERGVEHLTDLELRGQLAVIEEDGFYGHAVEGTEAGSPVLALRTELAALGE